MQVRLYIVCYIVCLHLNLNCPNPLRTPYKSRQRTTKTQNQYHNVNYLNYSNKSDFYLTQPNTTKIKNKHYNHPSPHHNLKQSKVRKIPNKPSTHHITKSLTQNVLHKIQEVETPFVRWSSYKNKQQEKTPYLNTRYQHKRYKQVQTTTLHSPNNHSLPLNTPHYRPKPHKTQRHHPTLQDETAKTDLNR